MTLHIFYKIMIFLAHKVGITTPFFAKSAPGCSCPKRNSIAIL